MSIKAHRHAERQMQELGVFVHGVLFAFHTLGLVYNARRKNWIDVAAHAAAGSYDLWAIRKHLSDVKQLAPVEDYEST